MSARFVHLRVRSIYSVAEGAIPIKALPGLCAAAGMPAVALTDSNNLFGALEFSETAARAGLQPIPGVSLSLTPPLADRPGAQGARPGEIALLAQSETGYGNLLALSSAAYLDAEAGQRMVTLEAVCARADGLICLTGGAGGYLGALVQAGRTELAEAALARLAEAFAGRLYVEVQRHPEAGRPRTAAEEATEPFFVEAAYRLDLPLVATNDAHFVDAGFFAAHDAFLCIGEGSYVAQTDRRRLTPEHWFKPADAMAALFADLPEAIENTQKIAISPI